MHNNSVATPARVRFLQEVAEFLPEYEYAGTARVLNFLIDNILMRFELSYITGIAIGAL